MVHELFLLFILPWCIVSFIVGLMVGQIIKFGGGNDYR